MHLPRSFTLWSLHEAWFPRELFLESSIGLEPLREVLLEWPTDLRPPHEALQEEPTSPEPREVLLE